MLRDKFNGILLSSDRHWEIKSAKPSQGVGAQVKLWLVKYLGLRVKCQLGGLGKLKNATWAVVCTAAGLAFQGACRQHVIHAGCEENSIASVHNLYEYIYFIAPDIYICFVGHRTCLCRTYIELFIHSFIQQISENYFGFGIVPGIEGTMERQGRQISGLMELTFQLRLFWSRVNISSKNK